MSSKPDDAIDEQRHRYLTPDAFCEVCGELDVLDRHGIRCGSVEVASLMRQSVEAASRAEPRLIQPVVGDDGCRCGGYCEHGETP